MDEILHFSAVTGSRGGKEVGQVRPIDLQDSGLDDWRKPPSTLRDHYGYLDIETVKTINLPKAAIKERRLQSYDILFCFSGRAGDLALVGDISTQRLPYVPNGQIIVLRYRAPDKKRKAIALYMWLRSVEGRRVLSRIRRKGKGSIYSIKKSDLEALKIPDTSPLLGQMVTEFAAALSLQNLVHSSREALRRMEIELGSGQRTSFCRELFRWKEPEKLKAWLSRVWGYLPDDD